MANKMLQNPTSASRTWSLIDELAQFASLLRAPVSQLKRVTNELRPSMGQKRVNFCAFQSSVTFYEIRFFVHY